MTRPSYAHIAERMGRVYYTINILPCNTPPLYTALFIAPR